MSNEYLLDLMDWYEKIGIVKYIGESDPEGVHHSYLTKGGSRIPYLRYSTSCIGRMEFTEAKCLAFIADTILTTRPLGMDVRDVGTGKMYLRTYPQWNEENERGILSFRYCIWHPYKGNPNDCFDRC